MDFKSYPISRGCYGISSLDKNPVSPKLQRVLTAVLKEKKLNFLLLLYPDPQPQSQACFATAQGLFSHLLKKPYTAFSPCSCKGALRPVI